MLLRTMLDIFVNQTHFIETSTMINTMELKMLLPHLSVLPLNLGHKMNGVRKSFCVETPCVHFNLSDQEIAISGKRGSTVWFKPLLFQLFNYLLNSFFFFFFPKHNYIRFNTFQSCISCINALIQKK